MGHNGICLVLNPDKTAILAIKQKNPQDYLYTLPEYKLHDSDNSAAVLKEELKADFGLDTAFQRILPDTWSRLVFTQKNKEIFIIYYIFIASNTESFMKITDKKFEWVNFNAIQKMVFTDEYLGAIKILQENCGIITN